jgi:hypothetical protein
VVQARSGSIQNQQSEVYVALAPTNWWQGLYGSTQTSGVSNSASPSQSVAMAQDGIVCVAWREVAHGQLGEILMRCAALPE